MWFAALMVGDADLRKALIGVAGTLSAAIVGVACGVVSATWGDHLQRDRALVAGRWAALLEVSSAVDTYNRERQDAHRFRLGAKNPDLTDSARAQSDALCVTATATAFAARSQALSAVRKARDVVPESAALSTLPAKIQQSKMSPDEDPDLVSTDALAAEMTRYR
ncbi:hypothetical protein ACPPVT_02295 [Angustibacter sp. McL0619]|uniref:hypothetical protein n=1 Tax=Angustibacter sp. McL0619 TaxID=3415676 RepID=UPI003CEB6405